jgi:hypothetical protein
MNYAVAGAATGGKCKNLPPAACKCRLVDRLIEFNVRFGSPKATRAVLRKAGSSVLLVSMNYNTVSYVSLLPGSGCSGCNVNVLSSCDGRNDAMDECSRSKFKVYDKI